MTFEAMTCPRCGANLPYSEIVSGRQIIQCQVCRACMENPRFGEFKDFDQTVLHMPFNGAEAYPKDSTPWTGRSGDAERMAEENDRLRAELRRLRKEGRRATATKMPEVVGFRRTVWPYLTALFASASVVFASTLILVGLGLVDVDFGALFGMVGLDGVDEKMGIMCTIALTAGSMASMMACNGMPSKIPVVEMVEEAE